MIHRKSNSSHYDVREIDVEIYGKNIPLKAILTFLDANDRLIKKKRND